MKTITIQTAIVKMLKPIAMLLLRSSVSYQQASAWLKQAFVEAAEEMAEQNTKATTSWIATVTGINRKEVKRLREDEAGAEPPAKLNRAQRVINVWLTDPDYSGLDGEPRALTFDGGAPNFSTLVKAASGDMTPRAVCDELERIGAVAINPEGELALACKGYVAPPGSDAQWALAAQASADLCDTLAFNLLSDGHDHRFQRMVNYRHLPVSHYEEFTELASHHSEALLVTLNHWLNTHAVSDADEVDEPTVRTGIGIYHFTGAPKE